MLPNILPTILPKRLQNAAKNITKNIAKKIAKTDLNATKFINFCEKQSIKEADIEKAEKYGYETNLSVSHPFKKDIKLKIFIANFILMDYGTGAIFGCPAHDQRDYDFAVKYSLDIVPVIKTEENLPYTGDGVHFNSDFLNGLNTEEAIKLSVSKLRDANVGKQKITFRIRDWGVSRQRYWGCPIPIIFCSSCGEVPVPEEQLPIKLPDNIDLNQSGNPLENHKNWKNTVYKKTGEPATRETDTLDTFVNFAGYF